MFEVVFYIIVTVSVLAFCGQSKRVVIDLPDPEVEAAIELAERILETLEPAQYAASELASDVCLVVPAAEWLAPLRQAKRHDLNCMTAAEVRELCREHDIPVNGRGRIAKAVLDQLEAVI